MLDLQPRIDLKEIELRFRRIIDELNRASGCIGHAASEFDGGIMERTAHVI